MVSAAADKAKGLLGLNDPALARQYQGLVGPPLLFKVSGEPHRLWVKNQGGTPLIMRASDPAELDLVRDLKPSTPRPTSGPPSDVSDRT